MVEEVEVVCPFPFSPYIIFIGTVKQLLVVLPRNKITIAQIICQKSMLKLFAKPNRITLNTTVYVSFCS